MRTSAYLTVIIGFFLLGVITTLWWYVADPSLASNTEDPLWLVLPFMGVLFVITGSLCSLGLPYLIAGFAAQFFISAGIDDL